MDEDNDAAIAYSIASGEADQLVQFLTNRGQLQDAFLVATAADEGGINVPVCRKKEKAEKRQRSSSSAFGRFVCMMNVS